MDRADLAWAISLLLVATLTYAIILSVRYRKYERAVRQGRRHLKRVWRPFWMN